MPRRNPQEGDRVRPHDKTSNLRGIITIASPQPGGEVTIRVGVDGSLTIQGTWKELSKSWSITKPINTQRRVLTMPLEIDKELVMIGDEQGLSPEAVAIELLRDAIASR